MARSIFPPAVIFLLSAAPAFASGTSPEVYGRVSSLDGDLFRLGAAGEDPVPLELNDLVRAGDRLETGAGSFAEIELPGTTFFRLSASTRASLERTDPTPELSVVHGAVILSRTNEPPESSISSPALSVTAQADGMVRLDLDPFAASLRVRALRGAVTIDSESGARQLNAPEAVEYKRGRVRVIEKSEEDAFDRWNDDREKVVRRSSAPEEIAGRYQGLHDLEGEGEWVKIDGRWYWRPSVSEDWSPYDDGRWAWYPAGWTWIPYARWGYVTHHYGRWVYLHGGWCWAPDPIWAPAWVVWVAHYDYVAWAPCDFYGRAVVVHHHHHHRHRRVWRSAVATYFARDYAASRRSRARFEPREVDVDRAIAVKDPSRELAPITRTRREPGPVLAEVLRDARDPVREEERIDRRLEPEARPPREIAAEAPRAAVPREAPVAAEPREAPRAAVPRESPRAAVPRETPRAAVPRETPRVVERTKPREERPVVAPPIRPAPRVVAPRAVAPAPRVIPREVAPRAIPRALTPPSAWKPAAPPAVKPAPPPIKRSPAPAKPSSKRDDRPSKK